MSVHLIISSAVPEDIPRLARIASQREGRPLEEFLEKFQKEISNPDPEHNLLLAARLDGETAAFGRVRYFSPKEDSPPNIAPEGWYLMGLVVDSGLRRRGIGTALTTERLNWISRRSAEAFYFARAENEASINLHKKFPFIELTRVFCFPGATHPHRRYILFRIDLAIKKEACYVHNR